MFATKGFFGPGISLIAGSWLAAHAAYAEYAYPTPTMSSTPTVVSTTPTPAPTAIATTVATGYCTCGYKPVAGAALMVDSECGTTSDGKLLQVVCKVGC